MCAINPKKHLSFLNNTKKNKGIVLNSIERFPDAPITSGKPVSNVFLKHRIHRFHDACRHVHQVPYGYNQSRDDLMILFRENKGSCTTKHAVIATLAKELKLPIVKTIGIYTMNEAIVTGTDILLKRFDLPYIPMIHCFLSTAKIQVDLTEGNLNGKNHPIKQFLFTKHVAALISEKEEYLLYRKALDKMITKGNELSGIPISRILKARENGIKLLRSKVE